MEAKSPDRATVVPRVEDDVLLRGQGRYIADARWPNQAYACFVRSPHACARIAGVNAAANSFSSTERAVFGAGASTVLRPVIIEKGWS